MGARSSSGPFLVLAAATLWGTTGTAQALGPDRITPATVALVRMAGGATLLAHAVTRHRTVPLRSLWGWPLFFALATMAGSQPLFFGGVARTGVAVGTIVTIGSGPILAGLLAWAIRRERPGPRWPVATTLAVGGAVLLVSGGEAAGINPVGLLFAGGAGLAWAVYLVAAKSLFEEHPPVFVAGVVFAGAALILSPVLIAGDVSWLGSGHGIVTALWLGVVATALSYVAFATGLGTTPVAAAATLTLAEPLTAAVLGMTVLGEPARITTIGGMALIAAGIALLALEGTADPAPLPG